MLCKLFAEPLIRRFGYRRVLVTNTLLLGAMIASFALTGLATPHVVMLAMLAVFGIVNSLQFTAMNTLTLGDLDTGHASGGNSLLSVVMQLSMSLGVAATAALLIGFGGSGPAETGEAVLRAFHASFVCLGLLSAMAAFIFSQLGRSEAPAAKPGGALDPG